MGGKRAEGRGKEVTECVCITFGLFSLGFWLAWIGVYVCMCMGCGSFCCCGIAQ